MGETAKDSITSWLAPERKTADCGDLNGLITRDSAVMGVIGLVK
jgi:hypothetical protein